MGTVIHPGLTSATVFMTDLKWSALSYDSDMVDTAINTAKPGSLVPARALLNTWTTRDWRDGVRVDRLVAMDRLLVRTRHNTYEIIVVATGSADVVVRGGAFFPGFTRARVAGSSLGGSFLKVHCIHVGFQMELAKGRRTIWTSPVEHVAMASPRDQFDLVM